MNTVHHTSPSASGDSRSSKADSERRTRLRSVLRATERLRDTPLSQRNIERVLGEVGGAFGVDAVLLIPHSPDPEAPLRSQTHVWTAPSSPLDEEAYLDRQVRRRDVSSDDAHHTARVVPIHVNDRLWGTVQLLNAHATQTSTPDDDLLLSTLSHHLGAALNASAAEANTHSLSAIADSLRVMEQQQHLYGPVALLAPDGTVVYKNPSFEQLCPSPTTNGSRPLTIDDCLPKQSDVDAVRDIVRRGAEDSHQVIVSGRNGDPVYLHFAPIADGSEECRSTFCWGATQELPEGGPASYAAALQRRLHIDRTLVQASRLLANAPEPPFEQLLRMIGTALDVQSVQMAVVNVDALVQQPAVVEAGDTLRIPDVQMHDIRTDAFVHHNWVHPTRSVSQVQTLRTTTPILSSGGVFYGYIRLEYDSGRTDVPNKDQYFFNVLSEMLCTTLERHITHKIRQREQRRYTHFVDTISEAICRIDFGIPVALNDPVDDQKAQVHDHGVVAECNSGMAELFGVSHPQALIGTSVHRLLRLLDTDVFDDLVNARYHLRNYRLHIPGPSSQYLIVNTTAMETDDCLESLWISCTDVTEQVMLERRMVDALEKQQHQLGRDLHDRVGQQLAGTRMLMQNLSERFFSNEDGEGEMEGRRTVKRIVEGVKRATEDVSDLQRSVMPIQVERDGLGQALRELVSHINQHEDVEGFYHHDGTEVYDPEAKRQLYRIAQEAVRNALRHAGASTIEITLRTTDDGTLELYVADDGAGFDPDNVDNPDAQGLYSMRYRAQLIGATYHLQTAPSGGTQVTCQLEATDAPPA